jgi:hypothetical protein
MYKRRDVVIGLAAILYIQTLKFKKLILKLYEMAAAELAILSLRIKPGSPFLTYIGIKAHKLKSGDSNIEQSLFISGVPLNFGEDALIAVFTCFGDINQVIMHHNKVITINSFTVLELRFEAFFSYCQLRN